MTLFFTALLLPIGAGLNKLRGIDKSVSMKVRGDSIFRVVFSMNNHGLDVSLLIILDSEIQGFYSYFNNRSGF